MSEAHACRPLSGFEFAAMPVCPVCEQPKPLLGQWSPFVSRMICRGCSLLLPFPDEALGVDAAGEYYVRSDAPRRQREVISVYGSELRSLRASWKKPIALKPWLSTFGLPQQEALFEECMRCNALGRAPWCQRCEDELAVESYFKLAKVGAMGWSIDEPEDLLDKWHAHPRLLPIFERGTLPDYLFILMAKEVA